MTLPATSNMHKLNYVTDMVCRSRVQPSLLGEARGTERAAEIEPIFEIQALKAEIKGVFSR